MYSLLDASGKAIISPDTSLDSIVKYLDDNNVQAKRYRFNIIREGMPNIVLYTREEPLPDIRDVMVRSVFGLK
jgi:hypothetical protein